MASSLTGVTDMREKPVILYDPKMFDLQKYGGITRYFTNLIKGINKGEQFKADLPIVMSANYYITNFPQLINSGLGKFLLRKVNKHYKLNLKYCIKKIREANFDLFHATYFDPYFLPYLTKPLVITVHDMIPENHPSEFPEAELTISQKKTLMDAAHLIIAISNFTKQEIIRHYPDLAPKITVIYHGLPERNIQPGNSQLPQQFLLYVGDRSTPYKNFNLFLESLAPLLSGNSSLHLICAGGGKFSQNELDRLKELGISEKTSQQNIADSYLKQLYQQAMMFIYPSLEEGFGLPILEAFKNGCPVVCSNTSCLPEVGGDAVSYFDPYQMLSIREAISQLIEDTALRNQRIADGYEQVKNFSFESCLNQTLACYEKLISRHQL